VRVPALDHTLHTTEVSTYRKPSPPLQRLLLFRFSPYLLINSIYFEFPFTSTITLITQSYRVQNAFSLGFAIRFWAFALFSFRPRSMRHASDVTTGLTAFACSFDSSSIPRLCAYQGAPLGYTFSHSRGHLQYFGHNMLPS